MKKILDYLNKAKKEGCNQYAIDLLIDYIYDSYLFLETEYDGEEHDLRLAKDYVTKASNLSSNAEIDALFEKMILNY